jgi:hypothetical protein
VVLSSQQRRQKQLLDASQALSSALAGVDHGKLKDRRGDIASVLNAVFRNRRNKGGGADSSKATDNFLIKSKKLPMKKKSDSEFVLATVEVSAS